MKEPRGTLMIRTYFWVKRDAGHELEEYQGPGNEEDVEEARWLWCVPNVHQNYSR